MVKTNLRVVLLHNIISPHVIPLFMELSRFVNLVVLYCAAKEDNRRWNIKPKGFRYKILPNIAFKIKGKDLFTYFINPTIIRELNHFKPDVVIASGWDLFAYQIAFFYCKLKGIKFILWSGSTIFEPSWRRTISKPLVKLMVSGADSYIAYGTRAKEYLINLGADPKKIYISFNTTDIAKYAALCSRYQMDAVKIKKRLKIENKIAIMYYGQLIDRKGVDILIKAFANLQKKFEDIALLIIGSGMLRNHLENLTQSLGAREVIFIDDPGDDDVCQYYAIADIFVLPSREEVWGLVVNQAMASKLPVVVSNVAGSSVDLIDEGENGFIFKSESVHDLTRKLSKILKTKNFKKIMGQKSWLKIQNFYPKRTVEGVITAINSVL